MIKNAPYPLYHILPEITTLREMIKIKNDTQPDDIAFRYMRGRKTIIERSYSTYYHDVEALGTYLLKRGIRGQKIAIIGENSYRWLMAYMAIVNTGNIAVLIAKDASKQEVATLLFQSDADIVLVSRGCADIAEFCKAKFAKKKRFFSMDEMNEWLDKGREFVQRRNLYEKVVLDPDAMCTIFFTSGSTGISKGVMLSHRNMTSNIISATNNFKLSGPSMAVLPFNHAFGLVTAVFKVFHHGYSIFICSNLANFMREIPIAKPQTLFVVPLFVETFSKTIWRTAEKTGQARKLRTGMRISDGLLRIGVDRRASFFGESVLSKFGGNLEYIICGGAPLDPRFVKEFRSLGIELLNGYGITECSPVLAVNRNHYHCDGSVGQILPGCDIQIYNPDEKGQGEIVVKGPNVMLGYYNDPKSTSEVLRDGWFHTGDLGYINKNGFLFVTGRAKNLIILANGENVSPEEIEQYVERIPEVQEVVVYEDNGCITAEIFPEDSDLSRDELHKVIEKAINKMNSELPNHKHVQKFILREDEFEKTATKKIKRYKAGKKKADKQESEH